MYALSSKPCAVPLASASHTQKHSTQLHNADSTCYLSFSQRKFLFVKLESWRHQWFHLVAFQSQISQHTFCMSDVWLNSDIPPTIGICPNRQNCGSQIQRGVHSDSQNQVGMILAWSTCHVRSGPSGPMLDASQPQQSRLRELRLGNVLLHCTCIHFVQALLAMPVSHPVCTCCTKPQVLLADGSVSGASDADAGAAAVALSSRAPPRDAASLGLNDSALSLGLCHILSLRSASAAAG